MNINKVILSGRITSDPILKQLNTGNTVLTFNLETVLEFKSPTSTKRSVNYVDCVAWGKTAESYSRFLFKDSQVLIEGQIALDSFESKQTGEKRTKHKINVQHIVFLNHNKPQQEAKESAFEEDDLALVGV